MAPRLQWQLLALAILVGNPSAFARISYVEKLETTLTNGEEVDAYVTKPAALVDDAFPSLFHRFHHLWKTTANRNQAATIHRHAAQFIDSQSRALGHVNPVTAPFHQQELQKILSGHWPMVVFTEKGKPEKVLLTLAMAIPWGREPLPYQLRFYKRGVPGLPQNSYGHYSVRINNFFDEQTAFQQPLILYDRKSESFQFHSQLSVWLSQLPWAIGRDAEVKFFMHVRGANPELAAAAHALTMSYCLHCFAVERLPGFMRRQQLDFMRTPEIRKHLETELKKIEGTYAGSEAPQMIEAYFEGLRRFAWHRQGFQPFSAVSQLLAQISEKEAETSGRMLKLFLSRFRFPQTPKHDFMETALTGTEGVRTRIFELSMENYGLDTLDGLNPTTQMLAGGVRFRRARGPKENCPDLTANFLGQMTHEAWLAFRSRI